MKKLLFIIPFALMACGTDQQDINNRRIVDSLNLTKQAQYGSNLARLKLKEMELKNELLMLQKEIKDAEGKPDEAQEVFESLGDTAKMREILEKMINEP